MQLFDNVAICDADLTRTSKDGYIVATPRVARTGIQLYTGDELGRPDMPIIRVYRPAEEVFSPDALNSFAHKPVTDDHPPCLVDAKNWKQYSRGQAGDEVLRDGEFVRVPLALMDASLIKKVEAGKVEISVGYSADVLFESGVTPDGQQYDAKQSNIRGNHFAIVDAARGGAKLRFGDMRSAEGIRVDASSLAFAVQAAIAGNINKASVLGDGADLFLDQGEGRAYPLSKGGTVYLDSVKAVQAKAIIKGDGDIANAASVILGMIAEPISQQQEKIMADKNVVVDGITVTMSDTAEQVVNKTVKTLTDQAADLIKRLADAEASHKVTAAEIAKLSTDISTKDAEIATLKKAIEDAAITPDKLDVLVKDRENVVGKAKALHAAVVVDGKTTVDIMRQVVDAKLAETAKGWSDDQVKVSFDTMSASVKVEAPAVRQMADAFSTGRSTSDAQAAKEEALKKRNEKLSNQYKGKEAAC